VGSGTETPAQKKKRADDLRDCARRAKTLASSLGSYLDKTVGQATANPPIWTGPYAQSTTMTLAQRQNTLRTMAGDLLQDAARWHAEATRLDDEATKDAAHAAKNPSGAHK
jgi:hypothetical protein